MPFSSKVLMRLASVYLGGGAVKCCSPFVLHCSPFPLFQRRQEIFSLPFLLLFLRRLHDSKAVKEDMAAAGPQSAPAALEKGGGGLLDLGRHLGGDEAVPDEGVEPHLIPGEHRCQRIRRKLEARGTDGFVGVLSLFDFANTLGFGGRYSSPYTVSM